MKKTLLSAITLLSTFLLLGCNEVKIIENDIKDNTQINTATENELEEIENDFDAPENLLYENKNENFSILIPNGRTFQEDQHNFKCIIYTPYNDEIKEHIGIDVEELNHNETQEILMDTTINELKKSYNDFNEIDKSIKEIDTGTGINLIYSFTEGDYSIKGQQTIFVKNNKAYTFQYTATKETYEKYINEINEIIGSFTLLN